jgi:hypothetical protein
MPAWLQLDQFLHRALKILQVEAGNFTYVNKIR